MVYIETALMPLTFERSSVVSPAALRKAGVGTLFCSFECPASFHKPAVARVDRSH